MVKRQHGIGLLCLVASGVALSGGNASAKPPLITDVRSGLNGGVLLPSAISGVMERNYVQYITDNPFQGEFSKDGEKVGDHLKNISVVLPPTTAGGAVQYQSGMKGPSFVTSELLAGNYRFGYDVAYRHFGGAVEGDGVGVKITPTNYFTALAHRLNKIRSLFDNLYSAAVSHNYLGKTAFDIKDSNFNDQMCQLDFLVMELVKGTEVTKLSASYGLANLAPAVSLVAGYSSIANPGLSGSSGTTYNYGIIASKLIPIARPLFRHDKTAITFLLSIQQQQISFLPVVLTSITRFGGSLVWQDKVSLPEAPKKRWTTQVGLEYVAHTSLEQHDSMGAFLRIRQKAPDRKGDTHSPLFKPAASSQYRPAELTVFGGTGTDGYGYIGLRAGIGFSL